MTSFDVVLGVLDGMFTPNGPIVWVMTANDLGTIDAALKERPGRFRHVVEFAAPGSEVAVRLCADYGISRYDIRGTSLDEMIQVCVEKRCRKIPK